MDLLALRLHISVLLLQVIQIPRIENSQLAGHRQQSRREEGEASYVLLQINFLLLYNVGNLHICVRLPS